MTTLNRFRVQAIDGPHLTLHADHVYGWHWDQHLISSRTMALQMLLEPLQGYIRRHIPLPDGCEITWEDADALALTLPLGQEHAGRNLTDESWNRANVGRIISCVGVVARQHCYEMWNDVDHEDWDTREWGTVPTPRATLLIDATDPRWLAHLSPGMEWDSTAYDHDEKFMFTAEWRTLDVKALAKSINLSQDFSGMPILADALQDAGCDSADLLNHLRDPHATHVRGCWALDLILGKE